MTLKEAREAYIKKFGGYPSFLLMGADEVEELAMLIECIESGEELKPFEDDADY